MVIEIIGRKTILDCRMSLDEVVIAADWIEILLNESRMANRIVFVFVYK